jgi:FtsP/CotA-like multicopper oxidase with cupredoxin domain
MKNRIRMTLALCAGMAAVASGCASAPPVADPGKAEDPKPADPQGGKTAQPQATVEARPPARLLTLAELTQGFSNAPLRRGSVLRPGAQKVPTKLEVVYARSTLGKDREGNDKVVFVRTYNGQLIAPTIRARPGETLNIELKNSLPDDPDDRQAHLSHRGGHGDKDVKDGQPINTPHGFNVTNLHTHGLHVSPDFPVACKKKYKTDEQRRKNCNASDNVLIDIRPGGAQKYEIQIPADHPPGTHWYHAHKHGAVAMQVATGMAGALIIEGGIDDLEELKKANEEVMVFQQLSVSSCGRKDIRKSDTDAGGASPECTVYKNPEKKDVITAAYESCDDYFKRIPGLASPKGAWCVENFQFVFGPNRWPNVLSRIFRNRTSINGQVGPTINAKQGELLRWRMVHGGIRETIQLGVVRKEDLASQQVKDALNAPSAKAKRLPLSIVAYDGITTGRLDQVDSAELQPGYRVDTLLRADQPGDYYLVDLETSGNNSLQGQPEEFEVIAMLHVDASTAAPAALPKVEALAKLAPYKPVEDKEVKGCQYTTFSIDVATRPAAFQVNQRSFDPEAAPRTMELGTADEWVVNALPVAGNPVSHPFHIHVNPFEVVDGYDSIPKGTWKDTLLVNSDRPARLRTRYTDFTGRFVLHCHILDHEDQGMMEEVEVVDRGAKSSRCPTLTGANLCAVTPPADGSCANAQTSAPKK